MMMAGGNRNEDGYEKEGDDDNGSIGHDISCDMEHEAWEGSVRAFVQSHQI